MIKTDLLRQSTLTTGMISSVESFQEDPSFYSYSNEGLGDALSAIWDGIVKVFKWIGQKIADFFNWLFNTKAELEKFYNEDYEFTGDALKPKTWVKLIGRDAVKAANKDPGKVYDTFVKQANASTEMTHKCLNATKELLAILKKIDSSKDSPKSILTVIVAHLIKVVNDTKDMQVKTYLGGSTFTGESKTPTEAEVEESFKLGKKIETSFKFVPGNMETDDIPDEFDAKTSFSLVAGLAKEFAKITKDVFDDVRENGKAFKARNDEITKLVETISTDVKKKDEETGKMVAFQVRTLIDGMSHKEFVAGYIYIGKKMNDAVQFLNKYAKKKDKSK